MSKRRTGIFVLPSKLKYDENIFIKFMAKTKQKELGHGLGVVCGTTVVGERGQLVIPKEAREKLKTKTGDRFLVLEHYGKLVLIPEKEMRFMIENITKHLK